MIEKCKQLTLSQRIKFEEMLDQKHREFEIVNELDKSQSTIAKEVNKHKKFKPRGPLRNDNMYNCKFLLIVKKTKLKKRKEPQNYDGRTYSYSLNYKVLNPYLPTTKMDTVYNSQSGPYVQTFMFENACFMLGILYMDKTADSMSTTLSIFQDILSNEEYKELFSLLLTDRGTEFGRTDNLKLILKQVKLEVKCSTVIRYNLVRNLM